MKVLFQRIGMAAVACLALTGAANAQFRAMLEVDHVTVLQGEPIRVHLTVTNDSLYPMAVGPRSDDPETVELDFRVTRKSEEQPARRTDKVLANGLNLEPGEGVTLEVDVADWYNFYKMGEYRLSAAWTMGGATYESSPILIDVINGMELKSVTKDVPFGGGGKRTYSLRYWARDGKEHLFLRVNSEDGSVMYGVFELGELVRVYEPTIKVDQLGGVTVVHQVGIGQFRQSELKSTGEGVRFVDWKDVDQTGAPFVPNQARDNP